MLDLAGRQLSTYRVYCGHDVRDFYFDDNADLVMAENDVIYALERPTGMDPGQYAAGYGGPSFDCTEARATADPSDLEDSEIADTAALGSNWSIEVEVGQTDERRIPQAVQRE